MQIVESVRWSADGNAVDIIDQRELPARETRRELRSVDDVCDAISTLAVRGAPAIGVAAAMGVVLALHEAGDTDRDALLMRCRTAAARLRATRPTAVNLAAALDRMMQVAERLDATGDAFVERLRREATEMLIEDRAMCRAIGEHGAELIPDGARVLTHCNAGALATAGIGTALAAVYVACERGKHVHVYADETRPLLQGSRLTAWELSRAGIPVTVLTDGAAASLIARGEVDLCIVGADRIAANGDVANKVGTYGVALAAHRHNVPLYVAAPATTFDPHAPHGAEIPIEQRSADEVRAGFGVRTAPLEVDVYNPAFDVTPAALITAIISDRGVHRPPYDFSHGLA